MKIKGVLIDVKNEKVEVVEVEKELESYYKMIGCRCIDITEREIDGRYFDIVCDDEGLFTENPKISAVNKGCEPALVGNLFVVKFDGESDITSLNDDDIEFLMKRIGRMCTTQNPEGYDVLWGLEY